MLQSYTLAPGQKRITELMQQVNPSHRQVDLYTLRSDTEYRLLSIALGNEIRRRAELERSLIDHTQTSFYIDGFCAVCGRGSTFNTSFMYSYETTPDGKPIPNWREHLDCISCGFTNRIRASLHYFYAWIKPALNDSIYITEQTTPLYRWLKAKHPELVGSEYFGNAVPFGEQRNGIRNEDLTRLTFPSDSFDYVLSFDVMEHVSDDIAAFKEVYRCLRPGGSFLFGAPFAKERSEKLIRATLNDDDSLNHLLPPEYHGNPVDRDNGALCFRYFAWDMLDDLRRIGFYDPKAITYWSRDFAYLGVEQFLFVARKPPA
jgi:SAM-dependent methyltransferase